MRPATIKFAKVIIFSLQTINTALPTSVGKCFISVIAVLTGAELVKMASENGNTEREVHLAALTKAYNFLAEALDSAGVQAMPQNWSNNGAQLRNPAPPGHHEPRSKSDVDTLSHGNIKLGEDSSSDEEDESFFPHQHLQPESFSKDDLINHLRTYPWDEEATQILLGTILADKHSLRTNLFFNETESWDLGLRSSHYTIADITSDGEVCSIYIAQTEINIDEDIWRRIRGTNVDFAHAVGRITIIREPSPSIFAALHLTMSPHFDMDHIFRILSDNSATSGYMRGCLEEEPRQQGSFAFSLKYHTLVGAEVKPMPWQLSSTKRSDANPLSLITVCSSVVALSLEGSPMARIIDRSASVKRSGYVFDPFSPWRVLSIQCFPDWKSSLDTFYSSRHLRNGPEAFLWVLLSEYRDAIKRLSALSSLILKMFTPPVSRFMLSFSL